MNYILYILSVLLIATPALCQSMAGFSGGSRLSCGAYDPYDYYKPYAGAVHDHSGLIYPMAGQYVDGSGDPRDAVDGAVCEGHSFHHPRANFVAGFDQGLDWVNLSPHTNHVHFAGGNVDTFLAAIAGGDYSELGTDDVWHFCDDASDGLELLPSGECTHDGSDGTEFEWMYEQAALAMQDRPGKLALVGGEWTVSATPPNDTGIGGGHKVFIGGTPTDQLTTVCRASLGGGVDTQYHCDQEEGLYDAMATNGAPITVVHPCMYGGSTYFGPMNAVTNGGFDPSVIVGFGIKANSKTNNCLDPATAIQSNKDRNAMYFNVLSAGYHLYPSSDQDNHHQPHPDISTCLQTPYAPGETERTVIWAYALTLDALRDGMTNRRAYWARVGKPVAKLYASDSLYSSRSIMGGYLRTTDGDFYLNANVLSDGATFSDLEVWHNGVKMMDVSDADIACSASVCRLSSHRFFSDIDGWWLIVVESAAAYEVVTAPIWVNYSASDFTTAPLIEQDLVP